MNAIARSPFFSIAFFAAGISILLSSWAAVTGSVVNTDAICYLQSADTMPEGLHAAMSACGQAKWPFYSALIFGMTHLTTFSSVNAAYLLDGLFSLISVVSFVAIIQFFNPTRRVLWLAAIVILLSHEFNAVRQYIIRDHGFWAFYLISILFLLHYLRAPQWRYALGWSISLIIATLFRIEGVAFLLLAPLVTFFDFRNDFTSRVKSFFQLNMITLVGITGLCFLLLTHSGVLQLSRLDDVQFQALHGVTTIMQNFHLKTAALAQYVLGPDSAHDAIRVFILMVAVWYAANIITNVSVIYTVLVVYAWSKKLLPRNLVLWSYIAINLLVTMAFFAEHLFFSKRYLIALSLVLMVWVPFALDNLMQQWQQRKWPLVLALFLMVVSSLGGIFDFGYSKKYIYDAGSWLANNVPKQSAIYSNDIQVMYYSKQFGNDIFPKAALFADLQTIAQGKWKNYDYLALRLNKKEFANNAAILQQIPLSPIQTFANKRGDKVIIFSVRK